MCHSGSMQVIMRGTSHNSGLRFMCRLEKLVLVFASLVVGVSEGSEGHELDVHAINVCLLLRVWLYTTTNSDFQHGFYHGATRVHKCQVWDLGEIDSRS